MNWLLSWLLAVLFVAVGSFAVFVLLAFPLFAAYYGWDGAWNHTWPGAVGCSIGTTLVNAIALWVKLP